MKSIAYFLILFISSGILFAQINPIPNPSFEDWNEDEPVDWYTNIANSPAGYPVTQSDLAYHGSSAIKLEIMNYEGNPWGAFVTSDTFSVTTLEENPAKLSGYYRHTSMGDAVFIVNIAVFYIFGSFLMPGGFGIDTLTATDEYTKFTIPVIYSPQNQITAVSASINIKVHSQGPDPQSIGATALVDSLTLSTSLTDIREHDTNVLREFKLFQNYPNPFNPKTIIKYYIPIVNDVELSIHNLLGQEVAQLVSKKQPAGYHEVEFNGQNLSSGVYLYGIKAGQWQDVRKMIYLR
jgi:hypothetical protein